MTGVLADTWWMTARRIRVGMAQPIFLFISLLQPVVWLFLFGSLFEQVVQLGGFGTTSYLDYIVPGVVVMNALAWNMWAGMITLEEISQGTLNRFLITPVRRIAIMNGNVVEQAFGTTFQSTVIVLLGWWGGATFPGGVGGVILLILFAVLLGVVFGSLSNAVGMLVRQRESIIGINTMLLLPLTFVSTVFMPADLMPGWMATIAEFNPLNWAVVAGREALAADPDWGLVASRGGWLLGLAVVVFVLSVRTFRSYQRAV